MYTSSIFHIFYFHQKNLAFFLLFLLSFLFVLKILRFHAFISFKLSGTLAIKCFFLRGQCMLTHDEHYDSRIRRSMRSCAVVYGVDYDRIPSCYLTPELRPYLVVSYTTIYDHIPSSTIIFKQTYS
jgi:hypothetical protein